uniref:DENN domain-containing protein 1B-like n=1 Tax=Myxine glutinosa TaxID=7769 RepID=UPI00358EF4A2
MGSRLKVNPEHMFELFVEVSPPKNPLAAPDILRKFPQDFGDQEGLENVLRFCFPFDVNRVSSGLVGQNFTFVLTDLDGKQRFGFCRLSSFSRCCLCFLSFPGPLGAFQSFFGMNSQRLLHEHSLIVCFCVQHPASL